MRMLPSSTPCITWSALPEAPISKVGDIEFFSHLSTFTQKLAYHGDRRRDRDLLFSQVNVSYMGQEFNIAEDLRAIYGDDPISGNKEAHGELKRFFQVNFPGFPTTSRTPAPERN